MKSYNKVIVFKSSPVWTGGGEEPIEILSCSSWTRVARGWEGLDGEGRPRSARHRCFTTDVQTLSLARDSLPALIDASAPGNSKQELEKYFYDIPVYVWFQSC